MCYRLTGPSQFGRPELVREIAAALLAKVGTTLEARVANPHRTPPSTASVGGASAC